MMDPRLGGQSREDLGGHFSFSSEIRSPWRVQTHSNRITLSTVLRMNCRAVQGRNRDTG